MCLPECEGGRLGGGGGEYIQGAEKGPYVGFQQRRSLLSSFEASERKLRNLACFSGSSPRMEAGGPQKDTVFCGLTLVARDVMGGGGGQPLWGVAEPEQHRTPADLQECEWLGFGCDPMTHADGCGLLRPT